MDWAVLGLALAPLLMGAAMLWGAWRSSCSIERLDLVDPNELSEWPKLSVISPACDEEVDLESSLRSILETDYPDLEIVAINDRSTDRTPDIINRVAREDTRVVPLHIETLPDGWLGKLNAMAQGIDLATGDWLLFSDADVVFSKSALRRAIVYAESRHLDYLTALPKVESAGFLADTVFNTSICLMLMGMRPWAVKNPDSSAILGTGAFLLVRRSAYEAGPGLKWMRLEVADDQMVCALIKQHGGRCDVVNGSKEVSLAWYRSVGEMNRRMQKGIFACVAQFSLFRGVSLALGGVYLALSPLLALVPDIGHLMWLPIIGLITSIIATLWAGQQSGRPWFPSLFPGIGALLISGITLWGTISGWRQGGITWRGVFYSSELLNAQQRFQRRGPPNET